MADFLPVPKNAPVEAGDYLVELDGFPVNLPTDWPGVVTVPLSGIFEQFGFHDAAFRGDGNRLFISFRVN